MSSLSTSDPQILSAPTTVEARSQAGEERLQEDAEPQNSSIGEIEQRVREYFAEDPIMIKVAWCESKFRHFERDGSVVRGDINRSDIGVMQVNEYYHGKTADALGLDLHKLEDNLAYARYLYTREGTRPWNSSSHCWSKGAHIARK